MATEDKQAWASEPQDFLIKLNQLVDTSGGKLNDQQKRKYRKQYKKIIAKAK